jgi:hypothetical protein
MYFGKVHDANSILNKIVSSTTSLKGTLSIGIIFDPPKFSLDNIFKITKLNIFLSWNTHRAPAGVEVPWCTGVAYQPPGAPAWSTGFQVAVRRQLSGQSRPVPFGGFDTWQVLYTRKKQQVLISD